MVGVVAEKRGAATFYFLRHNSGSVQLKRYLGKKIPENIEHLKEEFLLEFYRRLWYPSLKTIFENYQKERETLPQSVYLQNFESFGITFTYNTQRIEGSSLTRADTRDLLAHGITPNRKSSTDTIETLRHYDLFVSIASSSPEKFYEAITLDTILLWHRKIFGQTMVGEAGSTRRYVVGIVQNPKIEFATVPEIQPRLDELFAWLAHPPKETSPVEIACKAHYDFVGIHPFGDGNGRISRLLVNCILLQYGYPLMMIHHRDRRAYFKSLERSQLEGNPIHFQKWFMKNYLKENKRYL